MAERRIVPSILMSGALAFGIARCKPEPPMDNDAGVGGSEAGGPAMGGMAAGGTSAGGNGGVGTGGSATGGSATGGNGGLGTGGSVTGGSATGGSNGDITGPCDLYAAASPATPCVAAYSTTRLLRGAYGGPLYQVRKGGSKLGTGGTTEDIGTTPDGFADGAAQDTFCGTSTCTISILYDQSGKGNDLKVAPAGCSAGTAAEPDYESSATRRSLQISGHKVYALYMNAHEGYRNNSTSGMPTGNAAQGIYEVVDGRRYSGQCCWDFGNASTNNCYGGQASALYFGQYYWAAGAGDGPWFLADFGSGGLWPQIPQVEPLPTQTVPSITVDYAFGILKTSTPPRYALRVANAQSGFLTTAYDGQAPRSWQLSGGIVLGIGEDNSNSSFGTFFEGVITAGSPSDATDAAVLKNVQAAKYGQ